MSVLQFWLLSYRIVSRPARLDITLKQQAPSLQNEFYLVQVVVKNMEDIPITNVRYQQGGKLDFGLVVFL